MKLNPLPASSLDPKKPRPGIYLGVPFEQYAATRALNNGTMGVYVETQAWSEVRIAANETETESQRFGTMFHQAYLEPEVFVKKVEFGGPVNERTGKEYGRDTKVWKEWQEKAEAAGKFILAHDDRDHFAKMILAVRHNPHANRLLNGKEMYRECTVIAELPYNTIEGDSGTVLVKTRPDALNIDAGRIADIKTTMKPISPKGLGRMFADFGYYRAGGLYVDALKSLTGEKFEYRWVVVKRSAPYDCVVCEIPEEAMDLGRCEYKEILPEYARCVETGWWPSYGGYWNGGEKRIAVVNVELPRWKLAQRADGE